MGSSTSRWVIGYPKNSIVSRGRLELGCSHVTENISRPPPCQGSLVPPPTSTSSAFVGEGVTGVASSTPSTATATTINWQQFHQFLLQRMTSTTAIDRFRYAKSFHSVLDTEDASILLQLTPEKRIHVMKALACLSKFQGRYDVFLQLRHRFNLKWSTGTEKMAAFERLLLDDSRSLDVMLQELKDTITKLPEDYANVFRFAVLTGLRGVECIEAIRLIRNPSMLERYYDHDRQCLQHYKFPNLFIRRTKACYISLVDDDVLQIAQNIVKTPTLNGVKMAVKHRRLSSSLKSCRKIFASYLRQKAGLEAEIVDLLQGRVPKSVFVRHYLSPSLDYRRKVFDGLEKLRTTELNLIELNCSYRNLVPSSSSR